MPPKDDKDRKGTTIKRPDAPFRSPSYSKRHASFDSPREVPLPSPSLSTAAMRSPPLDGAIHSAVFDDDSWELISPAGAKLHKDKAKDKAKQQPAFVPATQPTAPPPPPSSFPSKPSKLKSQAQQPGTSTILPYSRPYSLPETHSYQGRKASPPPSVDRNSSASLPLPTQVPFSALPKAGQPALPSPVYERTTSDAALRAPPRSDASSPESTSGSSGSLPSVPASRSRSGSPARDAPPPGSTTSPPLPEKRGAVAMPPAEGMTSHGGVATYRPPRMTYTPVPATLQDGSMTAMSRTPSLRSAEAFPPPDPPVILAGEDGAAPELAALDGASAAQSGPPAAGEDNRASKVSSRSSTASYEPFLSHAPPPVDSWIEVESTPTEYRLIVRLPGFKRDGITLATKKRRILHLVADSWEAGGGHFERRISFGYDADLAQVRAEFDGELLKVVIPRRMPPGMSVPSSGAGGVGAGAYSAATDQRLQRAAGTAR